MAYVETSGHYARELDPQQIWVYHIIGDIFYLLHLQIVIDMITGYCIDLAKFDVLYVSMKFE